MAIRKNIHNVSKGKYSTAHKPFESTFVPSLYQILRVPALLAFWDLEKTVLHETRVSGTVLWSPTDSNSPTYTYISQKPW